MRRDPGRRRLALLLTLLFLALALPTGVLIWQAWGQLKWESFHQQRSLAEELAERIDARLLEQVDALDAHGVAAFAFGEVAERSPLSAYPADGLFPGALGFFQVDAAGNFSTPLLPAEGTADLPGEELAARREQALRIRSVLAENRLLSARETRARGVPADKAALASVAPGAGMIVEYGMRDSMAKESATGNSVAEPAAQAEAEAEAEAEADRADPAYTQRAFDELKNVSPRLASRAAVGAVAAEGGADVPAELNLDRRLEERSAQLAAAAPQVEAGRKAEMRAKVQERTRRVEIAPAAPFAPDGARSAVRIHAFASEIDPFESGQLASGEMVLFRNVWQGGERTIQGLLVDPAAFAEVALAEPFRASLLSGTAQLVLARGGEVIRVLGGPATRDAPARDGMEGTLLYRRSLPAPLADLQLVFTLERLPAGPGAGVLAWTALVIALVLCGGFLALYFLGAQQIRLARQQQDFVAAVSHELKTPLTSIRMYGEMLLQGWVAEDKRRQYYQYIHDESERLSRLIANVLELARISRNETHYEPRAVRVAELDELLAAKLAAPVARAGFELRTDCEPALAALQLEVDPDCFAQIAINLVDNALKFARDAEPRTVELAWRREGATMLCFAVRDHGPGIPRARLRKVFDLFYRGGPELTRETPGTGIGLAIVRELAEAMGGRVEAANRERGAEIRVFLPLAGA